MLSVKLKTGEELIIKILHPPLGDYASKVGCWRDVREDLLGGKLTEWLFTPYFVGEIAGEVAGSMSYYTPTDTRDVGVVEFVQTAESHRQKGVASALMKCLIAEFLADGGMALELCTTNPIAGRLYENHGFWYNVGDGMRYIAPPLIPPKLGGIKGGADFNETYLAFCGTAKVRNANWGDLPRASILYNHREPNWFIKDYFTQSFRDIRFESHFVRLMRGIENQMGTFVVLENPKQRVVGAAVLKRSNTFYEQHIATLSFRVCPAYVDQTTELLTVAAESAQALRINTLQIYIADCDEGQKALAKAAGFHEEARMRNRLRDGERWRDLLIYTRHLSADVPPQRNQEDYYGARKMWQVERIASKNRE